MMKKISALIGAGAIAGASLLAAPAANAFPLPGAGICNYPGTGGNSGWGGWCDYPAVLNGSHYHCEWGGVGTFTMGGCTWRDAGNAVVGPPPAEQIMW